MTVNAPIYAFDDPLPSPLDIRALLGGKGAGLVDMTQQLGLPVPPGFVITTEVCREYLATGWPDGLDAAIAAAVERLGEATGARFGDPARPLLVSVRSGAPISMPGMMDTLLNVGVTPAIRDSLAKSSGDRIFAADTWLRFCKMYAEIVLGLPPGEVGAAAMFEDTTARGRLDAATRIEAMARRAGRHIPHEPGSQLRSAIEAVFRSWNSERARVYREREGISADMGTAVTVQAMVFGNLDDRSGTGVVFTRNPSTGEDRPFGDYLARAQGEDVVAGTHAVGGLEALRTQLPAAYDELLTHLHRLEHHYRDLCDVEFTVSAGRLFILQTRPGKRTPLAAARIAVEMADDPGFPLDRADAVERVGTDILASLANQAGVAAGTTAIGRGLAASPGVGAGIACFEPDEAAHLAAAGRDVVLIREQTSPEDVHGMTGAAAIVTTRGGVASHAAVIARGWSIPAVTSLEGGTIDGASLRVGGHVIRAGETITVDGAAGTLYLGDQRTAGEGESPEARTIRRWAHELGVEPGTRASTPAGGTHVEATLFDVVRTVQLKGLCALDRAAAYLETELAAVEAHIAANETLFRTTPRGVMLTPAGREWATQQLAEERSSTDTAPIEAAYGPFELLNHRFKELVTGWQLAGPDGQHEEAFRAMVAAVRALDRDLAPVISASAGAVPRLAHYAGRFARALAALAGGDASMLASPMKDSYHTVWFDFHEELICLTGRDRATEET
jgi:pyruvate,orthophosphate dikinase